MSQATPGEVFAVVVFILAAFWLAYKYLWERDLSDGIRDFHEPPKPVEPEPEPEPEPEDEAKKAGVYIHNEQNFYNNPQESPPEPEPIVKVRCEYCGTLHAEDEPKCPNCGAAG